MARNEMSAIKWLELNNRLLAINPQTGGWLLLDDLCKEIVSLIESGLTTEEISHQCAGVPFSEIDRLKNLLYIHNLIVTKPSKKQKCSSSCQRKHYPSLAVVKVTMACNFKCTYCYADAGLDQSSYMSSETAHKIVDEYVRMNPDNCVTMLMHGGEPLLNYKLVKDISEYSKQYGDKVKVIIQTNASLINDEIAEYFKANNIIVGISLDGPAPYQNATRCLQNGKGSFDQVLRGVRCLQKHDVSFGALGVMTANVAEHIDEILDFFLANDIYQFSFIPLMKFGRGGDDCSLYVSGEQIFNAYKKIYYRIIENNTHNDKKIQERTLANMALSVFANENTFMCTQTPCGAGRRVLGISNNGDIFTCDDFLGDPEYKIGNVHDGHFDEMLDKSDVVAKAMCRSKDSIKRCKDCIWKVLCGGVCHSVDHYSAKDGELENEICVFNKLMLKFLIEEFDKNPLLPELLNNEIPSSDPRDVFIALDDCKSDDSIDAETFESILKFHDVKRYEKVVLCGVDFSQNLDVIKMLQVLKNNRNHTSILLENSKLDCPEYKKYLDYDIDEIWVKPDVEENAFEVQLNQIKDLIQYRSNQNLSTSVSVLLPIKEDAWTANLEKWIQENLTSEDKILLYEASADSRCVLEKIRGLNLKAFVSVVSYSAETYESCKDLFVFEKQNVFFIDKDTLKGRSDLSLKDVMA